MEKTIEEKWQAVKDFLLAKMGDSDDVSWYDQHGVWQAGWWKPNWKLTVRLVDHKINETLLMEHPYHLQSADISILYSLFGLEKRDALEAERVFWTASTDALTKSLEAEKVKNANGGEFKDMLQQVLNHSNRSEMDDALEAERGKSAKLVEAFEEIKAMKIYGDDDTDEGFESESDAYHEIKHIAKNALEAYKEGNKDE